MEHDQTKPIWPNLIWQPFLATVFMGGLLYVLNIIPDSGLTWAIGAGALSSSCYIVFGSPSALAARPRNIIGGYVIAMMMGLLVQWSLADLGGMCLHISRCTHVALPTFLAAMVVGLVLAVMSIVQCQHPPAAGLSLVLVVDMRSHNILLVISVAVIALAFIKILLNKQLRDLVGAFRA